MVIGAHPWKAARRQCIAGIVPRWAIVAVLLIPLIAGCTPALEQAKPVTVHFAYPRSDTGTYTSLATEFKKSAPYITLDLRAIAGDARNSDPFNQFDPGDADCFSNSNLSLDSLVADGKIRSLDPWIENEKTYNAPDFYPGTAALLRRQDVGHPGGDRSLGALLQQRPV
jgi:ABC-type glycerol-3-phosphate transport system substrate-binding protein